MKKGSRLILMLLAVIALIFTMPVSVFAEGDIDENEYDEGPGSYEEDETEAAEDNGTAAAPNADDADDPEDASDDFDYDDEDYDEYDEDDEDDEYYDELELFEGSEFSYYYYKDWEVEEHEVVEGVTTQIYTLEDGFSIRAIEISMDYVFDVYWAYLEAMEEREYEYANTENFSEVAFYFGYDMPEEDVEMELEQFVYRIGGEDDLESYFMYFTNEDFYWKGAAVLGEDAILFIGADCTDATFEDDAFLFTVLASVDVIEEEETDEYENFDEDEFDGDDFEDELEDEEEGEAGKVYGPSPRKVSFLSQKAV
ncbi:MAG: hypothetical protein IJL78_09745 [Lachnospiraceae bacterium]|nr:hypothetical protein [Lachnospiraceae bacterium]